MHLVIVVDPTRFQDGDRPFQAAAKFNVAQHDDIIGGGRDPLATDLHRAQQLGHLLRHEQGHPGVLKVSSEAMNQLTEPAIRGNAERRTRQAIEHRTTDAATLDQLTRLIEEPIRGELRG
jgi:hypothetical protein